MPIMTYCILKQLFFSNLLYGFVLMIIVNQSQISQCRFLKAQCHEIFKTFFCLKDSTWAPYEQAKRFRKLFNSHKDIPSQSSKIACSCRQQLRGHKFFRKYLQEKRKISQNRFCLFIWSRYTNGLPLFNLLQRKITLNRQSDIIYCFTLYLHSINGHQVVQSHRSQ